MNRPFQRKGAISNTHVGREFEIQAREFLARQGIMLSPSSALPIGVNGEQLRVRRRHRK